MKKITRIFGAFMLGFLLIQLAVAADQQQDLYTGDVAVSSMADADRDVAIKQALQQVLIKVSGNSAITSSKLVQDDLNQAVNFVNQYNFYQRKDVVAGATNTLGLHVQFAASAVKHILGQLAQPMWSNKQRPTTLLWLAVQTANGHSLVGAEDDSTIPKYLASDAAQRGVPVILPMLDLQDMNAVSADAVWNPNLSIINQASSRYAADAVLVGHISSDAKGTWQGDWTAMLGNNSVHWQTIGNNEQIVLQAAINNLADGLASRNLNASSSSLQDATSLKITVTGINSLMDFDHVKQYLASLPPVKKLQTQNMQASYVVFELQAQGGANAVSQAINSAHHLTQVPGKIGLVYQWVG